MGNWTLLSATPDIRDRNDVYGHFFAMKFRFKYSSSVMGGFTEMPRLEWKETITMIEKNAGTWWQFVGDQYARNPGSMTFGTWTSRYVYAYYCVRDGQYTPDATNCLFDTQGRQLPKTTFPKLNTAKEQADAVRGYLKSKGGIMTVTVVDKPGINKPTETTVHKNRILTFDCGLRGMGARVAAVQHLTVDGSLPEGQWFRECKVGSISRPFSTTGFKKVEPPADVTILKPFVGGVVSGTYE